MRKEFAELMPDYLMPFMGAVLGLIIGSFLATVAIRWPEGRSAMTGRSTCEQCGNILKIKDLIPVFSYIFLSGRCRLCGGVIKNDHLIIELVSGFIGGIALTVSPDLTGLSGAVLGWFLITLAVLDLRHHWLPDKLTYSLAVIGLLSSLSGSDPDIISRVIGGLSGFFVLFVVSKVYKFLRGRDGLGGGDPKMLGAIGCWVGWSALPLVLSAATLAGFLSVALMMRRGKNVTATTALPLGSLMAIVAFPLWLYLTATGGGSFFS